MTSGRWKKLVILFLTILALLAISACGQTTDAQCSHFYDIETGACVKCGQECEHRWQGDLCQICSYTCPHESHDQATLKCSKCGVVLDHV